MKRNIRLTVEYDGSRYAGWQLQADQPTVQQAVEDALHAHLGEKIRVCAAGRTDSGVHAVAQTVNFFTENPMELKGILHGALHHLPPDVAFTSIQEMPADFDSRRSARLRWYRFFVSTRKMRPAIASRYITHIPCDPDMEKMRSAAEVLKGHHNFQAFRAVTCTATRTNLTLHPIVITELPNDIIQIDYLCRSFLQNMVRILTGTLFAAARSRLTNDEIRDMLATGKRAAHALTIPPHGLFLFKVFYEGEDMPVYEPENIPAASS